MLDVLVVDDDEIVRESVAEALEIAGHHVERACDGERALSLISKRAFDVAICDVHMPRLDGLTLFRRIRRETPNTSIIIMTSFGKISDAVGSLRDGAVDYVSKPFDPEEFARTVVGPIAERRALRKQFEDARAQFVRREAGALVGTSLVVRQLAERVEVLAQSDSNVLLTGERGTGKKLVARLLHVQGARRAGPFVVVPCAALHELMRDAEDGELREMRAKNHRDAWFHAAAGGTLVLDGVDLLPLAAQASLLRIVQEPSARARRTGEWHPLGVRVVSIARDGIAEMAARGAFLAPLFFRLNGVHQHVIPLRDRDGDLYALVTHFLRELTPPGSTVASMTPHAWRALSAYSFPGNVRELAMTLEHALALARGTEIDARHLPRDITGTAPD